MPCYGKLNTVLTCVAVAVLIVSCSQAGNVETRQHIRLKPSVDGGTQHFGTSVTITKTRSGQSDLFVGAPSSGSPENNGIQPGALYSCTINGYSWGNQECTERIPLDKSGSIGMSMTLDSQNLSFFVCGPQFAFDCPNSTLVQRNTGVCYRLDESNNGQQLLGPWPETCGGSTVLDLMVVQDQSTSVAYEDFVKSLIWINEVLKGFRSDIEQKNVYVGLIKFATSADNSIELQGRSFADLQGLLLSTSRISGSTDTQEAINLGTTSLIGGGRSDVTKLMVVITDGRSDSNPLTMAAAKAARAANITMVAVGVGNYNLNELMQIADDEGKVLTVANFDGLDTILKSLQRVIEESAGTVLEGAVSNTTNELLQSQAGFSSHYSSNGNVYLGAVGAYDRMGAVVEYRVTGDVAPLSYTGQLNDTELQMIMKVDNASTLRESYVGYSVTSGHFVNGSVEYVASGSPRYQSRGVVVVYQPFVRLEPSTTLPAIHPPSAWWQIGAYFGQSVLGIDLNQDELDDLIVSAPLYSDESGYDQGRVFVFMNDQQNPGPQGWMSSTFQPLLLRGSSAIGARFGYSLASVGDVDRNGYNDVIVGAPLEEKTEGDSGAVYVYYNSKDGLSDLRKQKILGKSIRSQLTQFGGSVASGNELGIDVDHNGYPDVVASAPSGDTIVVLRSRPVVAIKTNLTLLPSEIDLLECARLFTSNCTSVQVCLSGIYQAGRFDNNLFDMDLFWNVDTLIGSPAARRLKFETSKTSSEVNRSQTIQETEQCFTYNMLLEVSRLGSLAAGGGALEIPLRVNFSYDFSQAHKNGLLSAVLEPIAPNYVIADWTFNTGCSGVNQRCSHDLEVTATYSIPTSNDYLVMNSNPGIFSVHVQLRNKGPDFSYFTKVNVTSGSLSRSQVLGNCVVLSESDSSLVHTVLEFSNSTYALKDLMLSGQTCNFIIQYNLRSLTDRAREDAIDIEGVIYSNAGSQKVAVDEDQSNNRFSYHRQVRYAASLLIGGISSPDAVVYNRNVTSNKVSSLTAPELGRNLTNVNHVHTIKNKGPLIISHAPMEFSWPAVTKLDVFPLFYLYRFSCQPSSVCQCQLGGKENPFGLALDDTSSGETVALRAPEATKANLPLNLKCSDVTCGSIPCVIANMSKFAEVKVSASFKVWLPSLTQPGLATRMFSEVKIDTSNAPIHPVQAEYTNMVVTSVSEFKQPEKVDPLGSTNIGAIIGGILGGLGLLCIVVAILWKTGFFKSKYGEKTRIARQSIRRTRDGTYTAVDDPYVMAQ